MSSQMGSRFFRVKGITWPFSVQLLSGNLGSSVSRKPPRSTRTERTEDLYRDFKDPDIDPKLKVQYAHHADKIMRSHAEEAGRLPLRVRAELDHSGVLTYEMPGVDLGAVSRDWARRAVDVPAPEPVHDAPVHDAPSSPVNAPVPAEYAGRDADARRIEQGAREIVAGIAQVKVMHRNQILRQKLYGDNEAELEFAVQKEWLTIDAQDQVRLGPVPVPPPAPVPAKYAGKASV
jgi:hypothetical protein